MPCRGKTPCFAQLYVHDTTNEVDNGLKIFGSVGVKRPGADPATVDELRVMLNRHNKLVKTFREAGRRLQSPDCPKLVFRVIGSSLANSKVYSSPTAPP
jgi:hypothetical protein